MLVMNLRGTGGRTRNGKRVTVRPTAARKAGE